MNGPDTRSDGELLTAFAGAGDQSAFAALVQRHGPMVHGVCLRVLGDHHEAQDVAQAVFLTLARKAASLRMDASVGGWLHVVAGRLAIDVRRSRVCRQRREEAAMQERGQSDSVVLDTGLFRTELDAVIGQLPDRYRQPLVLFHLEGLSLDQTGSTLGLNANTLRTRLGRAREMLRVKLVRRGVAVGSVGVLTTLLSAEAGAAVLPASFVSATVKAAGLAAAGKLAAGVGAGAISPHVAALSKGALKMILMAKLKMVAAGVVACGLTAGSIAVVNAGTVVVQKAMQPSSSPVSTQPPGSSGAGGGSGPGVGLGIGGCTVGVIDAINEYSRAHGGWTSLREAIARIPLKDTEQSKADRIVAEAEAAIAKYMQSHQKDLAALAQKVNDQTVKVMKDPSVEEARQACNKALAGVNLNGMTAEQKKTAPAAEAEYRRAIAESPAYAAFATAESQYFLLQAKGYDVAPVLKKLADALTAEQMAILNKRMEQLRQRSSMTPDEAKVLQKETITYLQYGDLAKAIKDMELPKDLREKALAEVRKAEGQSMDHRQANRERIKALQKEAQGADPDKVRKISDEIMKIRNAGRDASGTLNRAKALLTPEQAAELELRVMRIEETRRTHPECMSLF